MYSGLNTALGSGLTRLINIQFLSLELLLEGGGYGISVSQTKLHVYKMPTTSRCPWIGEYYSLYFPFLFFPPFVTYIFFSTDFKRGPKAWDLWSDISIQKKNEVSKLVIITTAVLTNFFKNRSINLRLARTFVTISLMAF